MKPDDIIKTLSWAIPLVSQVQAAGLTSNPFHQHQDEHSDLDFFIYCTDIPPEGQRCLLVDAFPNRSRKLTLAKAVDPHWGTGDLLEVDGVPCWLLYFTCTQTLEELEQILAGDRLDRAEDGYFYPTGRLATWHNLQVLADPHGFIRSIQDRLDTYPSALGERLLAYHLDKLADVEDLERAVQRRDVLFYHFALDLALDHFLQALFALNRVYFPSRKRSLQYIHTFPHQPVDCTTRLLDMVRLGGEEAGLEDSYRIWQQLSAGLSRLVDDHRIE